MCIPGEKVVDFVPLGALSGPGAPDPDLAWFHIRFEHGILNISVYVCSARSPNRFFIDMRLSMQWLVATNDMKDTGGQNPLDAQSLRTINICLPECFA